jgi:hypothetical protein
MKKYTYEVDTEMDGDDGNERCDTNECCWCGVANDVGDDDAGPGVRVAVKVGWDGRVKDTNTPACVTGEAVGVCVCVRVVLLVVGRGLSTNKLLCIMGEIGEEERVK